MLIKPTLLIALCLLLFSCSKSDDDSVDELDVFSLAYVPLNSFDELDMQGYYYAGFKAEGRKASMLIKNSKACRSHDFLSLSKTKEGILDKLEYAFYIEGSFGCFQYAMHTFEENKLIETGKIFTTIRDQYSNRLFKGILEIGFQGEYLRIEDQISDYQRMDPNEKVYLYFKKERE
ncbi:MAG: hypothetical protein LBI32_05640 [Myroides odoratus]|jgi:hypothetical protein|nr:hypothetical protein [Myroides odoratus]